MAAMAGTSTRGSVEGIVRISCRIPSSRNGNFDSDGGRDTWCRLRERGRGVAISAGNEDAADVGTGVRWRQWERRRRGLQVSALCLFRDRLASVDRGLAGNRRGAGKRALERAAERNEEGMVAGNVGAGKISGGRRRIRCPETAHADRSAVQGAALSVQGKVGEENVEGRLGQRLGNPISLLRGVEGWSVRSHERKAGGTQERDVPRAGIGGSSAPGAGGDSPSDIFADNNKYSSPSLVSQTTTSTLSAGSGSGLEAGDGWTRGGVLRVGVICGGASEERGISLNSARSVLDHLRGSDVEVIPYYLDRYLRAYAISITQMYSNTPSDFDFKLSNTAQQFDSQAMFIDHLRRNVDIVFPAIHGNFGEGGGLQHMLEEAGLPFVGTGSDMAARLFDKHRASWELEAAGYATLPSFLIQICDDRTRDDVRNWFLEHGIDEINGRVVVKPVSAGSSVGVTVAFGVDEAMRHADDLISQGLDERALVEVYAEGGREFTAIIIEGGPDHNGEPVVLLPTEVELRNGAEDGEAVDGRAIFDYRRKYLPTRQVFYHTPARFPQDVISTIRSTAAKIYKDFCLRDCVRLDGWFLPSTVDTTVIGRSRATSDDVFGRTSSGIIIFFDFNMVSGMEQTSFLFQQAAEVGLSHSALLRVILTRACKRYCLPWPCVPQQEDGLLQSSSDAQREPDGTTSGLHDRVHGERTLKLRLWKNVTGATGSSLPTAGTQAVYVLFGGATSERQVSLISGTNVWLKLREVNGFCVCPFVLAPSDIQPGEDRNGGMRGDQSSVEEMTVWALPYKNVLKHTVEEVVEDCERACHEALLESKFSALGSQSPMESAKMQVREELRSAGITLNLDCTEKPRKLTLEKWISEAAKNNAVAFIAVHGGIGEDGTLQAMLEKAGVAFTGPGSRASRLCMDKLATAMALQHLSGEGILTLPKVAISTMELSSLPDVATWGDGERRLDTGGEHEGKETQWQPRKPLTEGSLKLWDRLTIELGQCKSLCIKPGSDGCSTGVARLSCAGDLAKYAAAVRARVPQIQANTFSKPHSIIEMPQPAPEYFLFEPFLETDQISARSKSVQGLAGGEPQSTDDGLSWEGRSRWVEITVGVLGRERRMHALTPSITVRESGDILSLEEKFQGGTGINLTPPPSSIIRPEALRTGQKRIQQVANELGLDGFARIDAFLHADSGKVIIIEANTVPGMTPSTVLFHQALAENPPLSPQDFLKAAVCLALERRASVQKSSTDLQTGSHN